MDITRDNFDDNYGEIEAKIIDCDFCSIDCEFTGITTYRNLNSFDTPKTRYDKIRKNDQNFIIIQFGLCLFKRIDTSNSYDCTAFNFYLFPQSNEKSKHGKAVQFSCLNSSIEFLIGQNFDFNKAFLKGLTYLSKDAEEQAREDLKFRNEINQQRANTMALPTNKNDAKDEIVSVMTEIEKFSMTTTTNADDDGGLLEFKFTNTLVKIFVEKNIRNMYRNRLQYQYKTTETKERVMQLTKINNPGDEHELKQLDKATGFAKVIWLLSTHGKLIVGHNMLIDMMLILKQFFSPLPDQYDDFRMMLNSLFPRVIDTKYITSVQPLKDLIQNSTLSDLDKALAKDPFTSNATIENCKYSVLDEKLHEAGYDAFLTGFCYIRMLHYLQALNKTNLESINEHYMNKVCINNNNKVVH
jgi:poly(A)-specific ribonuclease